MRWCLWPSAVANAALAEPQGETVVIKAVLTLHQALGLQLWPRRLGSVV